jgi:cell division septum initiation protein DivIVA
MKNESTNFILNECDNILNVLFNGYCKHEINTELLSQLTPSLKKILHTLREDMKQELNKLKEEIKLKR